MSLSAFCLINVKMYNTQNKYLYMLVSDLQQNLTLLPLICDKNDLFLPQI